MYLENITLREIQPCTAAGHKIKIKANLSSDISELYPYLNSVITSAVYNKEAHWLTMRLQEKIVTFNTDGLSVTKLINETDAYETLDHIKDIVNNTFLRKDEISANDEMKKPPTPLEIYKRLPKTNCKQCGETTCLAFAGKLLNAGKKATDCQVLLQQEREIEKDDLENLLRMYGL